MRRIAYAALSLAVVIASVFFLAPTAALSRVLTDNQEQTSPTHVAVKGWPANVAAPPIQVTGINYRGSLVVGTFQAPSTWMNDLTVRVRNVSAQTLLYIEVKVEFPRDEMDNPILPSFFLRKGRAYLYGVTGESDLALGPGEEIVLAPSNDEIQSLARQVAAIAPPDSILHSATVRAWVAAVSPVRLWYKGAYLDRDPNDPKHWIVDQQLLKSIGVRLSEQRATLKTISYQPSGSTLIASVHIRQGCFRWVDVVVDQCTNCGGEICTAAHDKYRTISPNETGFRLRCTTDTCIRFDPDGTPHNCSCTHLEIHVNFDNGCEV